MIRNQIVTQGQTIPPFTFGNPPANSCLVDNYSSSWLFSLDANTYVPPFSSRTIGLPFPEATPTMLWQAPPGIISPPLSTPPGQATIAWSDATADTTSTISTLQSGPIPLGTVTNGNSNTFPIPAFCEAVKFSLETGSGYVGVLNVTGVTTSLIYYNGVPTKSPLVLPIDGATEQAITVTLAPADVNTVTVTALIGNASVTLVNEMENAVYTAATRVTMSGVSFVINLTNGNSSEIIAATSAQSITLYNLDATVATQSVEPGGWMVIQDDDGIVVAVPEIQAATLAGFAGSPLVKPFPVPIKLSSGAGLRAVCIAPAGVTLTLVGSVQYTQGV